jgi:uncharacterized protein
VSGDMTRRLTELMAARPDGIVAAYLYGSFARGENRPGSDIDVGILLATTPTPTFDAQPYELEGELERALGRPVQVVVLNRAPVDLRIRVWRDGQLIVDREPAARIRFEVQTRNEAFDLEAILRRYRAAPATRP